MTTKLTALKLWMRAAEPEEQKLLARRAKTSRSHLYLLAGEHANASPKLAHKIAAVAADMRKASKGRLPEIFVTDLSDTCSNCEYARKCLGARALRSDFPIVNDED